MAEGLRSSDYRRNTTECFGRGRRSQSAYEDLQLLRSCHDEKKFWLKCEGCEDEALGLGRTTGINAPLSKTLLGINYPPYHSRDLLPQCATVRNLSFVFWNGHPTVTIVYSTAASDMRIVSNGAIIEYKRVAFRLELFPWGLASRDFDSDFPLVLGPSIFC